MKTPRLESRRCTVCWMEYCAMCTVFSNMMNLCFFPPFILLNYQAAPGWRRLLPWMMRDSRCRQLALSSASAATWWLLLSVSLLLLMEWDAITIWMEGSVSGSLLEGVNTKGSILLISLRFPHSTTYSPHTISPAPSKLPHEPMLQTVRSHLQ